MADEKKYRGVRRWDRNMYYLWVLLTGFFGVQVLYAFLWGENLPERFQTTSQGVVAYGVVASVATVLCAIAASGFLRLSRMP